MKYLKLFEKFGVDKDRTDTDNAVMTSVRDNYRMINRFISTDDLHNSLIEIIDEYPNLAFECIYSHSPYKEFVICIYDENWSYDITPNNYPKLSELSEELNDRLGDFDLACNGVDFDHSKRLCTIDVYELNNPMG